MKSIIILIFNLVFIFKCYAQNLVPNPGIEFIDLCYGYNMLWYSPNHQTTDFWGKCSYSVPSNYAGVQEPYEGNGYAGIRTYNEERLRMNGYYANYREYLAIKLMKPLERGFKYKLSFKYSVADYASLTSDDLGMYLSKHELDYKRVYEVIPQLRNPEGQYLMDDKDWGNIAGDYIAEGGEQYLYIGNFLNDEETTVKVFNPNPRIDVDGWTYFYIDNVEVIKDTSYMVLPINPGPNKYHLTIPNLVTFNNDNSNDSFKIFTNEIYDNFKVSIYNRWGAKVFNSDNQDFEWKEISDSGLYYYYIKINNDREYTGWLHVVH